MSAPEDILELVSSRIAAGLAMKIQAASVNRPKVSHQCSYFVTIYGSLLIST